MNVHIADIETRGRMLGSLLRRVMQDATVAIVHGGDPGSPGAVLHETFNPRATKSYRAVAEDIAASLRRSGFRKVEVLPDGLQLGAQLSAMGADIAWVNSGGVQGYNAVSHTPAMLELMGLPYVGHDPLTVSLLDNKHVFKHLMRSLGIPTADFITWDGRRAIDRDRLRRLLGEGPYVVKPVSGRASIHVTAVDDLVDLPDAMRRVFDATQNDILVEHFLPGAEYAVAISGGVLARAGEISVTDEPSIFSPVQRVLEEGERIFTSMDVRPITQSRLRLLSPDDPKRAELSALARAVHGAVRLGTLVRLDVRASADGACHVLEVNPKPDLKAPSDGETNIVSLGLPELDMNYDDLVLSLLADRLDFYARHPNAAPGLARFLDASPS